MGPTVFPPYAIVCRGKRLYYSYISADVDTGLAEQYFREKFEEEKLEWIIQEDPQWKLISEYAKKYSNE